MTRVAGRTFLLVAAFVLLNTCGVAGAQEGVSRTRTVTDGRGRAVSQVERYVVRTASAASAANAVKPRAAGAAGVKTRPQFSRNGATISSTAFGSAPVAGQSVAKTLTFDASSGPLTIAATIGKEFTLTSTTCGASTCSAVVTFAPAYPGLRDDAITATDTSSGTLVAKTFVYGTGVGPQFGYQLGNDTGYQGFVDAPTAITVGPDLAGYVTDAASSRVYTFNRYRQGNLAFQALPITGLAVPSGIAVDGSNTVYVADQTNNVVVTYTSAGVQSTLRTSALSSPQGLAVDGTGAVYIADTGNNRILRIDNQGAETTVAGSLNGPAGVAVDAAGDVFFSDQGSGGEVVELPAGGGAAVTLATSIGVPLGVAVDPAGDVYYTNGSTLTVLLAGGNTSGYGATGEVGVAVAPNGDLYTTTPTNSNFDVTDRSSGNFIVKANVGGMGQGGLTIANTGNATLNLGGLTVSEAVYSIDPSSQCKEGAQVAAGATCSVTIDYNPVTPGNDPQTFTAASTSLNVASQNVFNLYGSAGNTTTTETASASSVSMGQPVTFTATVSNTDSSATPTGTVVFEDGIDTRTTIGTATLGAGAGAQAMAALTTSSLSVGQHQVRAVYQGSGTLATSASDFHALTVVAGSAATTASLAVSAANVNAGAAETLTATIQAAASPGVTGTVTFYDQSGALGSGAVTATSTGGTASLTITFLSVGSHQIYGLYNGDGTYAPSTTATQTVVVARASTTASLTLSAATISVGQAETLTATVAGPQSPTATGTVTFYQGTPSVGGTTLGTVTLTPTSTGGTASLTVASLPVGNDPVYASYSGDTNYIGSVTGTQTVTVTATSVGTTTTLTVDRASVVYRTPIALTAAVMSASGGAAGGGQVIFCDAAAAHCTPELSLGTAQVNANGLAVARVAAGVVGSHGFTATFLGTGTLGRSVSAPLTVTVTMQSPYATSTTAASTGSVGSYGLTGTVVGFFTRAAAPGGTVTFSDTTNAAVLGTGTLGAAVLGFQAVQPIGSPNAAGKGAYGVATGDFNADGYPDVAVENYNANTVSVLLGKGNGEFQPQVTYAVGSQPERVLVADFNGDGRLDLVVANTGSGTVSVLLGNGDGTFQTQVTYGAGSPVGLGVMDVNHDGFADIVAGDYYQNTVSVLLGNGDGTFQAAVTYATGTTPQTLAEGDFNGDGNVDLAVGNFGSNTVGILLGNGDGTFRAQVSYAVGPSPQGVQVGDFNGDGNDDLAVTNSGGAGTVSVLLGNGDGTFQPQVAYGVGSSPVGMAIADFNGDGFQDLSVGNTGQTTLTQSILLGNGDGTFQTQKVFRTGNFPYGEAVADFNGDGFPDLAIANFNDGTATILLSEVTQTATASISGVSIGSPSGTHTVTASYGGDANFSASTSAAIALMSSTPVQAATATTLTIMPGTQTLGLAVAFAVSVRNGASTAVPTGSVTLTNVATAPAAVLGTITLGAGGSGTFSTAGLAVGTYSVVASYGGDANDAASASAAQGLTVMQVAQTITFPAIANHSVGDAAFLLNATASSGLAVTYALVSGPAALSGGSVTVTGAGTVVIQATQAGNATYAAASAVTQSFNVVAAAVPAIVTVSPASAVIGAAATTVTLTGTNFAARDAVQLNGATIGSAFVSATTLTATIPAAFLAAAGTGQLTVVDAAGGTASAAAAFTVVAKPAVTFTGPATSGSGQQPTVTVQLVNPYPAALTGTLTLAFAPSSASGVDDPAVQFASGGRTLTFTVPANSTVTPAVQLQTGTVAGTATITLGLVSNGLNVTPANATPVVIAIAAAVPAVTTASLTRMGSTLSVVVHGFSNTREVATATFHFAAAAGSTISTPDLTVTVTPAFATWYGSTASTQYGSSFTYTQQFTLDADASTVGGVTVMLVNAVGASVSATAQ